MKARILLGVAGLALLATGTASADPILDVIYHSVTNLEGCLAASVQGSAGIGFETGIPPHVTVGVPVITPPSPDCLVLPAP
jgi:hypothetical protein